MKETSPLRNVALWLVLFAAGAASGYGLRERRAHEDRRADALIQGLDRAAQAQLTLVMLEEKREAQLTPLLERQLANDIRLSYQALSSGELRLPVATPSLGAAMKRSGEYLARRNAPKDVLDQAAWLADHLTAGR